MSNVMFFFFFFFPSLVQFVIALLNIRIHNENMQRYIICVVLDQQRFFKMLDIGMRAKKKKSKASVWYSFHGNICMNNFVFPSLNYKYTYFRSFRKRCNFRGEISKAFTFNTNFFYLNYVTL